MGRIATGQIAYLQRAEQIAQTALNYHGSAGRFATQDAVFSAIFFKNLLQLDAAHPDGSDLTAMRRCADSLWEAVDPATGLLELKAGQPVPLHSAGVAQSPAEGMQSSRLARLIPRFHWLRSPARR